MEFKHVSVLLQEAVQQLNCRPGGIYVDCTLGGGGHAGAILEQIKPGGRLIGIDQDADAIRAAQQHLAQYGEAATVVQSNFVQLKQVLNDLGVEAVDGVLFDLGVSSYQLDTGERGFSYQHDALLDMRMDRSQPLTAAVIVNEYPETELARIIRQYGEEQWAKRIAQFIVRARAEKPLQTTGELVEIIKAAIPARARREGPHPAKRTFQALRIAVNNELGILAAALRNAVDVCKPGGRVCVVTFHSLEDRIVKQTFQDLMRGCDCPPGLPVCVCGKQPQVRTLTSKPISPSPNELVHNPRARSAKLRGVEKLI